MERANLSMKKRDLSALKSPEMGELERKGTALAKEASAEGAILLENNGLLPMKPQPVALYGYGARLTMVRGIGSGDITYRYTVNIEDGLENNGFHVTTRAWLDRFDELYSEYRTALLADVAVESAQTGVDNLHVLYGRPHILPDSQDITDEDIAASGTDFAIYVISRKEGEGRDNRYVKGEYMPSDQEVKQIAALRKGYKKLVVVLNTGTPIEMKNILASEPDAVIEMFQGGAELGNVLADILSGKVNPSGKTTSTWAKDYFDYSNSREYGENDGDVKTEVYREGVYLGYRYFDSFDIEPQYPFGYGLSYTKFVIDPGAATNEGSTVKVTAKVTNVGERAGKEVVQLYLSSPNTNFDKPYQDLVAFVKTKLLAPGESETVTLSFNMEDFTHFCTKRAVYFLEAGDYVLRLGNSSRNTRPSAVIRLTGERITRKVKCVFSKSVDFEDLKAPKRSYDTFELADLSSVPVIIMEPDDIPADGKVTYTGAPTNYFGGKIDPNTVNKGSGENVFLDVPDNISLSQVRNGEYTLEEMVASMDAEELIRLSMGEEFYDPRFVMCNNGSYHVPGAAGETTNYFIKNRPEREIPYTIAADGPAGLRLITRIQVDENGDIPVVNPLLSFEGGEFVKDNTGYQDDREDYYQYVTGLPISIQLASTWNMDLLYKIGDIIGAEMVRYDVNLWLAPGLNLHRNPICGRNFEYFSEDPVVSAQASIALTLGVQRHPGRGTTIKHLAANNQETARTSQNSVVSERTMRELYLRGFEMTVKYSDPYAIMTSLNCVNGPHGTNSRELATYIVRDEWHYRGLVTTDWNTTTPARGGSTTGVINAGDDIIMPGSERDVKKLHAALTNLSGSGDTVTVGALQRCAMGVLKYILRTGKE
jgi:beta-glucosidase